MRSRFSRSQLIADRVNQVIEDADPVLPFIEGVLVLLFIRFLPLKFVQGIFQLIPEFFQLFVVKEWTEWRSWYKEEISFVNLPGDSHSPPGC